MGSEMRGRTVLVTGASRGIGLAVSRSLAEEGAWVGMIARGEKDLAREAAGCGGHAIPTDIAEPMAVHGLVEYLQEEIGGPPDVLVNSAGTFALAPFAETDPDAFERHLAVNLRGAFLVIRAFLPALLARGSGHIVNIGSIAGRVALPGNAAYSASKYGLRGLHEVLAAELRGTGLRASLIEPAATDTPLWDALDPDARDDLPSRSQMLRPEDVARAVHYVIAQPAGVEVSLLAIGAVG
jgi:NAD(P)-dependent dehydrogenase (short-subunit alcohol dehydrogenase family)